MPISNAQILDHLPSWKRYVQKRLAKAPIDFESFGVRLQVCAMEDCRGMCCYDGVCIDRDEERMVRRALRQNPEHFEELGVDASNAFEEGEFQGLPTRKTQTRPQKFPRHVSIPRHFDRSCCVFKHEDGRCSLQSLAMKLGEHPWAFKPISCWLHPLSLERDDETILWVPRLGHDHLKTEEYAGFTPYTHCGKECTGGKPAWQALKFELECLGAITGRDFYGEIAEFHAHAPQAIGATAKKNAKAKKG